MTITGHQHMVRAIIADLESTYGASVALPITSHLALADAALRKLYQSQARHRNISMPSGATAKPAIGVGLGTVDHPKSATSAPMPK